MFTLRILFSVVLTIGFFGPEVNGVESLVENTSFQPANQAAKLPRDFELNGDVWYRQLDSLHAENAGWGVRLFSNADIDKSGSHQAKVYTMINPLPADAGRWFRLQIRGLAEEGFHVEQDDLYLQVDFYKDGGNNPLDHIKKRIYPQIRRERADLTDAGTNRNLGKATWRWYALDFKTPFAEVDSLKLTIGLDHGAGKGKSSEFVVNRMELLPITAPTETSAMPPQVVEAKNLVPLGGRWYFAPEKPGQSLPQLFTYKNAHQLIYWTDKPTAIFAGNMKSILRKGYLDRLGNPVPNDRPVDDNLTIEVTNTHLVCRSKNLPNHPTAVFPDRWRMLDGNPNYVREQRHVWSIPLVPRENPNRRAMTDGTNNNGALPMGAVGMAVNGVIFFNPFDHLQNQDAIWRVDRCCGHPSPGAEYHYHKYPVCLKSPWTDDGGAHSSVLGFAFDGYPIYGPYEAADELAKDSASNPLNEFNVHSDEKRGIHYHVTPGQFPHLIGGYWGVANVRNRPGPGGPMREPFRPR